MNQEQAKAILLEKIPTFKDSPAEAQDALIRYYITVEFLSKSKSNIEFTNKDAQHGSVVGAHLLSETQQSLKIFTGSFKGDISNTPIYLDALRDAVNRNVKIDVVFAEHINKGSECYKLLTAKAAEGKPIKFYQLKESYKEKVKSLNISLCHFLIGDEKMWRYEYDIVQFKATCNFDDKVSAKKMTENFDALIKNSNEI